MPFAPVHKKCFYADSLAITKCECCGKFNILGMDENGVIRSYAEIDQDNLEELIKLASGQKPEISPGVTH